MTEVCDHLPEQRRTKETKGTRGILAGQLFLERCIRMTKVCDTALEYRMLKTSVHNRVRTYTFIGPVAPLTPQDWGEQNLTPPNLGGQGGRVRKS